MKTLTSDGVQFLTGVAFLVVVGLQASAAQVSIDIDYTPPPGADLGTNEYRAASTLTLTCQVEGATGTETYSWQTPRGVVSSNQLRRNILRSDDTGTHTCTATGTSSSASVEVNVVGIGIYVITGTTGDNDGDEAVPNNALVISRTSSTRFRLVCRSESMEDDVGDFIGLNENTLFGVDNDPFDITPLNPGGVQVRNDGSEPVLTDSEQGVYTCRLPDSSGTNYLEANIGIYMNGFNTSPTITNLTYDPDTRTLTCTSTGSPATTVTWRRNGGDLTLNGSTYQTIQRVTNRSQSTYENVLSVNDTDFTGEYMCTVVNTLGMASQSVTVSDLSAVITTTGTPTVGGSYNLTCMVTGIDNLPMGATTDYEWRDADNNSVSVQDVLQLTSLELSDAGQYTCQATITSQALTSPLILSAMKDVVIQILCPDPADIENGMVTFTGNSVGDNATYTCNSGFNLIGSATATCMQMDANPAVFSPTPPECRQPLSVTITTDYTPPPGVDLSTNEYRAASSLTLTCQVEGATGTVTYNWMTSFNSPENQVVGRDILRSSDSRIHTCAAMDGDGNTGSTEVEVNVVGIGIYIITSGNAVPDNALVISGTSVPRFRLLCRSESTQNNVGDFIGLDGSPINNIPNDPFEVRQFDSAGVDVRNTDSEPELTVSEQGVYTCRLPDSSGTNNLEVNIGIYPNGFNTMPSIASLTFDPDTRTLICTSTGSPATTVTWRKDNTVLNDGSTYQLTQRVTDRRQSTYENVLTIGSSLNLNSITGTYTCIVGNVLGSQSRDLIITMTLDHDVTITTDYTPPPDVDLGPNKYRAASTLTLTCQVEGATTGTVTYSWQTPREDDPSNPLQRNILRSSDNGMHTCTATDSIGRSRNASVDVTIVGIGIYSITSGNAVPYNALVISGTAITSGTFFRLQCRSESMEDDVGDFIGLDGSPINDIPNDPFDVRQFDSAGVDVRNTDSEPALTASEQGVYTCRLPDSSGTNDLEANIGIYPNGFNTPPSITSLTFDPSTRTLTCTSTGSPATTVTWSRDGVELSIDGSTYQMTQRVTNRRQSTYENILSNVTSVGNYTCLVMNVLGSSSESLTIAGVAIMAPQQPLIVGEMATITCSIELGVTTIQWLGPNGQVVAEDTSGQQQLNLTFNPVNESIDGQQYICRVEFSGSQDSFQDNIAVEVEVPPVSVEVTAGGTQSIGESYTLTCSVSGADNLQASITYEWRNADNGPVSNSEQTPHILHFNPLQLSDGGQYTCQATISSPLLERTLTPGDTESITLQIPSPQVEVTRDGGSTLYAGSRQTLTCTITLDSALQPVLSGVTVSSQWSGPGVSSGRDTVTSATGSGLVYSSTLMLDTLRSSDTGLYNCSVTVNSNSAFLTATANVVSVFITVQNPTLMASLLPSTTRLPNVAPYNSFSLTCTATAPEGVVAEKTFTWRQSLDGGNFADLNSNGDNVEIETTDAAQPVSTSVLTVTETTAGEFTYTCEVAFNDSDIASFIMMTSVDITQSVTSPSEPSEAGNFTIADLTPSEVTLQWTVPIIAFTPETYVVHYGTDMDSIDMRSEEVQSGNDFESENSTFSVELMELEAGTEYYFQVNSTNSIGSTLSSVESFTTPEIPRSGDQIGAIAGGVVGGLFGVILVAGVSVVIIAAILWLRRSKKLWFSDKPHSKAVLGEVGKGQGRDIELKAATVLENRFPDDDYLEDSSLLLHGRLAPVPIPEFRNHVIHMHEDRDKGFELEYHSIEKQPLASQIAAEIPYNKTRNRFVNIAPYDFNRVKLQEIEGIEGSDYINASFIDGYEKQDAYIAAQGPKDTTVTDFWRMIWEYRLPTVVMLTRCFEAGKVKCKQYWPEAIHETITPGCNLSITLTSVLPFAEYEIRKLVVTDTSSSDPPLEVTHLYYQGWPDYGVPTNSTSLINFIKRVRRLHPPTDDRPLLVHCSAGVGRSGTFIVLDSMVQRIKAEGTVNVYEFLKNLRTQRVLMVQTEVQYVFIHDALNELITCGETEISAINLRIVINRLTKQVKGRQISGFRNQFENLNEVSRGKAKKADYSRAQEPYNHSKNRYPDKLANNACGYRLQGTAMQGSDYINASFVAGYKKRAAYIATQGPLRNTVNDFWRMVWEYQSKCIVMLCNLQESGVEMCYPYWPKRQGTSEVYGKVKVTLLSEEPQRDYIIRKLKISEAEEAVVSQAFTVTQFQYTKWEEHSDPSSTNSLLDLISNVTKVQMGSGNKAITVMCNDGVGRSGTFMAIHTQIERLKTEGVVDFFQYIKSARIQREGVVQSVDQYMLCHEVLADYVDTFTGYANFRDVV